MLQILSGNSEIQAMSNLRTHQNLDLLQVHTSMRPNLPPNQLPPHLRLTDTVLTRSSPISYFGVQNDTLTDSDISILLPFSPLKARIKLDGN